MARSRYSTALNYDEWEEQQLRTIFEAAAGFTNSSRIVREACLGDMLPDDFVDIETKLLLRPALQMSADLPSFINGVRDKGGSIELISFWIGIIEGWISRMEDSASLHGSEQGRWAKFRHRFVTNVMPWLNGELTSAFSRDMHDGASQNLRDFGNMLAIQAERLIDPEFAGLSVEECLDRFDPGLGSLFASAETVLMRQRQELEFTHIRFE